MFGPHLDTHSAFALVIGSVALAADVVVQEPDVAPAPRVAPAAAQAGGPLELALAVGDAHRYRVRLGAGTAEGGAGDHQVLERRLSIVVARAEQDGRRRLSVRLDAPSAENEADACEAGPERAAAAPVHLDVRIDARGALLRVDRVDAHAAPGSEPALAEEDLRRCLELALGTGLHSRELVRGDLYPLGAERAAEVAARPAAEPAGLAARLARVELRYQGPGAGRDGRRARFALVLPDPTPRAIAAGGALRAGERAGVPAGDASYSAEDGLLTRLSFRPQPRAEDAAHGRPTADWLEIERLLD